jgi:hypothetical protein
MSELFCLPYKMNYDMLKISQVAWSSASLCTAEILCFISYLEYLRRNYSSDLLILMGKDNPKAETWLDFIKRRFCLK